MTVLLQQYLIDQAECRPDDLALVMEDERLTYGEVEKRSNRLARLLLDAGCRPGDRVCLLVPKDPSAIVAMLAVLKAGCIYVPVDIATPAPRVALVARASEPRLLLAAAAARALVDDLYATGELDPALPVGSLEEAPLAGESFQAGFSGKDLAAFSDEPLSPTRRPEDIAHILFTSGSTGVPKGVTITHANVVQFVEWAVAYFGIGLSDRNSGHPPLHFDLSTFDIYGTLAAGAQLHIVPTSLNLIPHRLTAFIRDSELTQWFSVPSILTYMASFDALEGVELPSLRRLLWCGEVLPTPTLAYWMTRLPQVEFTNLYGPTEATIASSYFTVSVRPSSETEPIPIGLPCEGEELLVLDESRRPVEPGEIGEIYIAGLGLSPGYWQDEEKTRAAFMENPYSGEPGARMYRTGDLGSFGENGLVYFHGRADSQIKSRGYRIELGEIETALNALDNLAESAVVGIETDGFEGTSICCAYAPADGVGVGPRDLRAELTKVLPTYMLPGRWLAFETLPKNVNGKIDRKRLKELFAAGADRPAERESPRAATPGALSQ